MCGIVMHPFLLPENCIEKICPTLHPGIPIMDWPDYSLIDCGGQEKLERFGPYILRRPEPQAIWAKQAGPARWDQWDAFYTRSSQEKEGGWKYKGRALEPWWIRYDQVQVQLQCTAFGHVGIFPEQRANWQKLAEILKKLDRPKVLNLFAYTGVASLVAKQAGADVVHVDAVPNMISWARRNMEKSGLADIRWVVEDVSRFVQREVRRGNNYDAVLLDPPAYGRGPAGEKWMLADHLDDLLAACAKLLGPGGRLILLNMYSMGFSAEIARQLLELHFPSWKLAANELIIFSESRLRLPLGIYGMGENELAS